MLSLDNAFSADELRAWASRVARDAGVVAPLPDRAEDRRAGDQPALRGRPADARADPRRRAHGRGRDQQRADRRRHTGAPPRHGPARAGRGPRRGVLPGCRLRRAQRAARRGRTAAVRQPAQRGRRVVAAEGPSGDRDPTAADARARAGGPPGIRGHPAEPGVCRAARLGTADVAARAGRRRPGSCAGGRRVLRRAPPSTSSTRSTVWSSRSTRSRSSATWARPLARRAGRSPTSTLPRRSTPGCWTSA